MENIKQPIALYRQVFIIAGVILLIALGLTWWVSPWFSVVILVIAIAQILSGITGICYVAQFLSKMPYNCKNGKCQ